MSQGPDKQVFCKLKVLAVEGLESEEVVVYETISKAGNHGIWTREIRIRTGLVDGNLNKVIKSLEKKKKIKSVKSVQVNISFSK